MTAMLKLSPPPKLLCMHIINDLDMGGAEKALCRLVTASDRSLFQHVVVTLLSPGVLRHELERAGIEVLSLHISRSSRNPVALLRLARLIKKRRPDMIQTWLYLADILGGLAARLTGAVPVIFSIRHGSFVGDDARTIGLARLVAILSHLIPDRIISCSQVAGDIHSQIGYASHKLQVIPNGFTIVDKATHSGKLRAFLGVPPATRLIGMIGRFFPAKDHAGFVAAAALVKKQFPGAEFVLCGLGVDKNNAQLCSLLDGAGVTQCCHLLGRQTEIAWILADLDILVSSSASEGFSNVIGESMAAAVPCVVTNVGDSAHIVGNAGIIVPPNDHKALATGIVQMLSMADTQLAALGLRAQSRISQLFSLAEVVGSYEKLYLGVINDKR